MPPKKLDLQFYADECFPVGAVKYLKSLGYSIVHAYGRGLAGKRDFEHLKEAKKLGRVLITLDRDFLYYEQVSLSNHPGVVVVSSGSAVSSNINKICEKFFKKISKDFVKNSLVRVTSSKMVKTKNEARFEKDL